MKTAIPLIGEIYPETAYAYRGNVYTNYEEANAERMRDSFTEFMAKRTGLAAKDLDAAVEFIFDFSQSIEEFLSVYNKN